MPDFRFHIRSIDAYTVHHTVRNFRLRLVDGTREASESGSQNTQFRRFLNLTLRIVEANVAYLGLMEVMNATLF
jgi:hypothetical protein